jgi:hypothetical protein
MEKVYDIITLLDRLDEKNISYSLARVRPGTIMIEVAVPGQRWEIDFNTYGDPEHCSIEVEKFKSDGVMYDETELEVLFGDASA